MKQLRVTGLGVAALMAIAGCSGSTKTVAGPTTTATATATATQVQTQTATVTATPVIQKVIATRTQTVTVTYHPTYDKYAQGTYVVGTDIQPGTYHTDGGATQCYWATLNSLDPSDIDANGNPDTGPTTIQIKQSNKAFVVSGDCTFGRR